MRKATTKTKRSSFRIRGARAPGGNSYVRVSARGRHVWIKQAHFMTDMPSVTRQLGEAGILLTSPELAALKQQALELRTLRDRALIEYPGWTGGSYFTFPGGQICSGNGQNAECLFSPASAVCVQAGELERWLKTISLLQGQTLAIFILMTAFLAPLMRFTRHNLNPGFEICGERGAGKTTLLQIVATTTGNGFDNSREFYWEQCLGSGPGLEDLVMLRSDLPVLLDDLSQLTEDPSPRAKADALRRFAFFLAQGKTRALRNKPAQRFRTAFVCTNNELASEVATVLSASLAGATTDRILSLDVSLRQHGIFDFIPAAFETAAGFSEAIEAGLEANYGTAMPRFVEQLVELRCQDDRRLRSGIEKRVARFRAAAQVSKDGGSPKRIDVAFGLVSAAGQLAQHFGVLPSSFDCEAAALATYRLHHATVERASPSERLKAYERTPGVRDLDAEGRFQLGESELLAVPGVWKTHRRGFREFLVHPDVFKSAFVDWKKMLADPAISSLMSADGKHMGEKRGICLERPHARFYCFRR